MSWQAYPLIFRLKSPLHIGWRKVGNLHQTRPYVTGKVMWAALTARLTRQGFQPPSDIKGETDYIRVGNFLNRDYAFSYFFPAIEANIDAALYPKLEAGGVAYGIKKPMSENEFQYLLFDSYASTALDYSRLDKEEGSLHETEFIRPQTRSFDGEELGRPVYLVGYIFSKNGIDQLKSALDRIQLGAERRYGWGRIELTHNKFKASNKLIFQRWRLNKNETIRPEITAKADTFLPAHALAADFGDNINKRIHHSIGNNVKGVIEPLVGRETIEASYSGRKIADVRICWLPGSSVKKDTMIEIGDYSIWEGIITSPKS